MSDGSHIAEISLNDAAVARLSAAVSRDDSADDESRSDATVISAAAVSDSADSPSDKKQASEKHDADSGNTTTTGPTYLADQGGKSRPLEFDAAKASASNSNPQPRNSSKIAAAAQVLVGTSLDHYELLELVGGGGMGAVFKARDARLDRIVAVKVIPASEQDAEMTRRFKIEAQSAAKLDHPHIARVYYVGEVEGWSYIVFEFVEGVNLRELVLAKGPLSIDEAVWFSRQVAESLTHASARFVVHRDIKPSNVLVTKSGFVKLVDMGLARTTAIERTSNDLTASNITLGTFDYISPEQARDPRAADVRSDLYSLGCTLYFLLSGQPPFPQGTAIQKLMMHGNTAPTDIRQFRSDVPDELATILNRLMAKNPNQRYQQPIDLINDLYLLAEFEDLPRSKQSGTVALTPTIQEKSTFESFLPWLVVLGLLAGVVLWMQNQHNIKSSIQLPHEFIDFSVAQVPSNLQVVGSGKIDPLAATRPAATQTATSNMQSVNPASSELSPEQFKANNLTERPPQSINTAAAGVSGIESSGGLTKPIATGPAIAAASERTLSNPPFSATASAPLVTSGLLPSKQIFKSPSLSSEQPTGPLTGTPILNSSPALTGNTNLASEPIFPKSTEIPISPATERVLPSGIGPLAVVPEASLRSKSQVGQLDTVPAAPAIEDLRDLTLKSGLPRDRGPAFAAALDRELSSSNSTLPSAPSTLSESNPSSAYSSEATSYPASTALFVPITPTIVVDRAASGQGNSRLLICRTLPDALAMASARPEFSRIVLRHSVRVDGDLSWSHPALTIAGPADHRISIEIAPLTNSMPQFRQSDEQSVLEGFKVSQQTLQLIGIDVRLYGPESNEGIVCGFGILPGGVVKLDQCSVTLMPSSSAWKMAVFATLTPKASSTASDLQNRKLNASSSSSTRLESSLRDSRFSDPVQIFLQDCVVRGGGDFLNEPAAIRTELQWINGLAALDGRLVDYAGARFEDRIALTIRVELQHVTAALQRGFARLKYDASDEFPVCLTGNTESCAYITDADAAFFEFDGVDELADRKPIPQDQLTWSRWLDIRGVDNAYDTNINELIRLRADGRITARFDFEACLRSILTERSPEASLRWVNPPYSLSANYRSSPKNYALRPSSFQPGMRSALLPTVDNANFPTMD